MATYRSAVTNVHHEMVHLNSALRALVPLLDGKTGRNAVDEAMLLRCKRGDFQVSLGGQPITDPQVRANVISELISAGLQWLLDRGLLVS